MGDGPPVVILGGGLAGLSCAWHLRRAGVPAVVLERAGQPGGVAGSDRVGGFTFDRTGHWLHLRDPALTALALERLGGAVVRVERRAAIRSHGVLTRYPFQANTFGLPADVVRECVLGFVRAHEAAAVAQARGGPPPVPPDLGAAFRLWFGDGICRHFMVPYNEKLWGVPLSTLTAAWCTRFVPRPTLDEVIGGAVGAHAEGLGYNPRLLYPARGGIGLLADALADALGPALRLRAEVCAVGWRDGAVELAGGEALAASRVVSTLPLPALIARMSPAPPPDVAAAAGRLRATSVAYVNYGVRGPVNQGMHWVYFPEPEAPFYRVGSYSNVAPHLAPAGHGSLYVETSVPPGQGPPDFAALLPRIRRALVAQEVIASEDDIVVEDPRFIAPAYVLYDHAYEQARATVLAWLAQAGVASIGRYGRWHYASMEDALADGRDAAAALAGAGP